MSGISFLQRIVLAASAAGAPAARAAPAGPLTLGRLVRLRRLRLARLAAPAAQLAPAEQLQLNEAWPEAGPDPAREAPKTPSAASEPREVAGDSERADVSGKRLQRQAPEVSRLIHERIESGRPAGNAQRSVFDTVAKDQSDTGQPALVAVPADPPSHRPATSPSLVPDSGRVPLPRVERTAQETAATEEQPEDEPPSIARAIARAAAADAVDDLEEQEEETPAVARAVASAPPAPSPAPRPVPSAAPQAPAAAAARPASFAVPAPSGEAGMAGFEAPPEAPPAAFEHLRDAPAAPLGTPHAPARPDPAAEPVVHIGTIEVVIESPTRQPRSEAAEAMPAAGLASRLYLRGL